MVTKSPPILWYNLLSTLVENLGPFIVTAVPPSLHLTFAFDEASSRYLRKGSENGGFMGRYRAPGSDPGSPS